MPRCCRSDTRAAPPAVAWCASLQNARDPSADSPVSLSENVSQHYRRMNLTLGNGILGRERWLSNQMASSAITISLSPGLYVCTESLFGLRLTPPPWASM